jgi:MFS family permease
MPAAEKAPDQGQPPAPAQRASFVRDLRAVWAEPGFRRLFSTRLISQAGDGLFTAGLGGYVFFNATNFPNPVSGAAAFAVLYLPYSLIGPFAGVFIDRWSRRQILVRAALIRSLFVAVTAGLVASGKLGIPLYVGVLAVLGVNRFFLSALSAALPHVVPEDKLVMANSVSPTAGGIVAAIGGIAGLGVHVALHGGRDEYAATLLAAGCCYVAAGFVSATMRRDQLGPARGDNGPVHGRIGAELAKVLAGLAAGASYIARRRRASSALAVTGASRLFYGILFLMSILLYRNYFYRAEGANKALGHYALLTALVAIGYGAAAFVTPVATRRLGKPAWITVLLGTAALATATLGEPFAQAGFLVMAFFLGLAGQGIAICATTILQEDIADAFRGRAFSFYDMTFNVLFVAGAAISAEFMPMSGKSGALITAVAIGYAVTAAGYYVLSRREPVPSSPADS